MNEQVRLLQACNQPVISVDTSKMEGVGNFANGGSNGSPRGQPELERVHDFVAPDLGKAIPPGV